MNNAVDGWFIAYRVFHNWYIRPIDIKIEIQNIILKEMITPKTTLLKLEPQIWILLVLDRISCDKVSNNK